MGNGGVSDGTDFLFYTGGVIAAVHAMEKSGNCFEFFLEICLFIIFLSRKYFLEVCRKI